MRSSRLPCSPRWRICGDSRCVVVATKSPSSNQKTLAGGTADDVDSEGVRILYRFHVADNLSVPCILGVEFIEQNTEAILPRLCKIFRQDHVRCTAELRWPTPILACLKDRAWDRPW